MLLYGKDISSSKNFRVMQMLLLVAEPGLPPCSWDTVPVYIHFGKTSGPLSAKELRFVAKNSTFVCFEKGHAKAKLGSTEKGIEHDAKRLKELNPDIKVLFYWNSFLNYQLYDACAEFGKHPEWVFRDKAVSRFIKLEIWSSMICSILNSASGGHPLPGVGPKVDLAKPKAVIEWKGE